jgi:hypothetical protein
MKRIDKALKSITDEEILYFLDNIASRLMVPIRTERGTVCEEVETICMNGRLFQLNTESFNAHCKETACS